MVPILQKTAELDSRNKVLTEQVAKLQEQAGDHAAQLKEKDDEISRLHAKVESLKKTHQSELEKLDQEFFQEKGQLTLHAQKDKELLGMAEATASSFKDEHTRLEKKQVGWKSDLAKII